MNNFKPEKRHFFKKIFGSLKERRLRREYFNEQIEAINKCGGYVPFIKSGKHITFEEWKKKDSNASDSRITQRI